MFRDAITREAYEKLDSVTVGLWNRVYDLHAGEELDAAYAAYALCAGIRDEFRLIEDADDMEHDPACHNQTSRIPAVWASDEEGTGYRCPECGGGPKEVAR